VTARKRVFLVRPAAELHRWAAFLRIREIVLINFRFLGKWLVSYLVGMFITGVLLLILLPCAILSMFGSGFMAAWILYHLSVVPFFLAISLSQAFILKSIGPFGIGWIASTTGGWLAAAIFAMSLPEVLHQDAFSIPMLLSLWIFGGFLSGVLQWAAVFRTRRSLIWIVASILGSLSIPAVVAGLSFLFFKISQLSFFPSGSDTISIIASSVFGVLETIGIAFIAVTCLAAMKGISYC